MSENETGAAAPADASSTPATEGEQAKKAPETEAEEFVVLPEGEGDEHDDEDGDDEEGDEDKPKRLSRSQRLKAQRDRATARAEAAERELADLRRGRAAAEPAEVDDAARAGLDAEIEKRIGKPPKESDYPGDYLAYDAARRRWETRAAVAEDRLIDERAQAKAADRGEQARTMRQYNERLEKVKDRIPDFSEVLKAAPDMEVRNDVRDLILNSDKGPLMAYFFAKNPEKLEELNDLSPVQAARAFGRLEARIIGPRPKKATTAPPPPSSPKGGGAPPPRDPGKMSFEDYKKARETGAIQ